jgi:hypothetical protein
MTLLPPTLPVVVDSRAIARAIVATIIGRIIRRRTPATTITIINNDHRQFLRHVTHSLLL